MATSGRHNSAMITDRRILTAKINLYGMSSFHFDCFIVFSKRQRITLRLLNAIAIPSVVCLSVVCDVGAPYSGG